MGICQALHQNKSRCGRQSEDYFWFHDSHNLIDETFHICHDHSQSVLSAQMQSEDNFKRSVSRLKLHIESLKRDLQKGSNVDEEREKIKQAIAEGLPRPKFKKMDNLQRDIKIEYEKLSRLRDLINNERNRTCRWCGFALKQPEFESDHVPGNPYSHADFHSSTGFRRETMMYHTECGRQFMLEKFRLSEKIIAFIKPRRIGQHMLVFE